MQDMKRKGVTRDGRTENGGEVEKEGEGVAKWHEILLLLTFRQLLRRK